jgi:hypothetical protein
MSHAVAWADFSSLKMISRFGLREVVFISGKTP